MRMRGLAGVLVLVGCGGGGDGGTEPTPPPTGQLSATLVGSTQRQGVAGEPLAEEVAVQVNRGSQPASGITVQFVVADAACGQPATASTTTNASGRASTSWTLGSKAGTCALEVKTVESAGAAAVSRGSVTATVAPAAADTVSLWTSTVFSGVTRVTVPVGDSVRLSSVVRRAADRFGNLISSPTVTATRTKGSATIRGGFLVAPASEENGEMQVTVGNVSSTVPFSAVRDLRKNDWSATMVCRDVAGLKGLDGVTPVDSVQYDVVSDSVTYYALGDERLPLGSERGPVASFYFSGRSRAWLQSGGVDTTLVSDWRREIIGQRPDTLAVLPVTAILYSGPAIGPSVRTSSSPVRFTGGTFCPDSTGYKTSPKMTLTAQ